MKKIILYISIFGFLFISCEKDLDEAAINKNYPENVSIAEIFPSAQQAIAYTLGNSFAIHGGIWGQYWTQGSTASQYLNNEKYTLNNSDQDRPWGQMYADALNDLKIIRTKALVEKDSQIYAMALVMEAYAYQVVSDAYEKAPMKEAIDITNLTPAFDEPTAIYDAIATKLIEAKKIFSTRTSPKTYSYDLFYSGDIDKWELFTNTLLLKVYMRQAYARPTVAQAGIAANLTGASFLSDISENAMTRYINAQSQKNPLNASQFALANYENLKASNTSLNALKTDDDLRIGYFYNEAASTGLYTGFNQGAGRLPSANTANGNFSNIGDKVGGPNGHSAPVIFMSSWESYFLQAEAAARGWLAGSASSLYENGIIESHLYFGLTAANGTDIANLHPLSGGAEAQAGLILAQKWISMNGTQCFEGYTELRRMNYSLPYVTFPASVVSVYGPGFMPHRFPLPSDEVNTNPNASGLTKPVHVKMWFSK
jgi:hypothetical protein